MTAQPGIHISQKHRCIRDYTRTPLLRQVITNSFISQSRSQNADGRFSFDHSDIPWLPIPTPHATLPNLRPRADLPPLFRYPFRIIPTHPFKPLVGIGIMVGNASKGFSEFSISTNGSQETIPCATSYSDHDEF